MAVIGEEDVPRFKIAMSDAFAVRRVEGIGHFESQIDQPLALQRPPL